MSLPIIDVETPIFILFGAFSVAAALVIVNGKNVFYSAISLGVLGISVAVLIALLDPAAYAVYSVLHLLLYVGATVVFIAISLVLFRGLQVQEYGVRWAAPIATIMGIILLAAIILSFSSSITASNSPIPPSFNLSVLSQQLLIKYWFPTIIIIVALATTLVEAITLARRD
jgi:NADH-quinone oxidoreductase subunit J